MAEAWATPEAPAFACLDEDGAPDEEGWVSVPFDYERLKLARKDILRMGPQVRVIEPEELRRSVADWAARINALNTAS